MALMIPSNSAVTPTITSDHSVGASVIFIPLIAIGYGSPAHFTYRITRPIDVAAVDTPTKFDTTISENRHPFPERPSRASHAMDRRYRRSCGRIVLREIIVLRRLRQSSI